MKQRWQRAEQAAGGEGSPRRDWGAARVCRVGGDRANTGDSKDKLWMNSTFLSPVTKGESIKTTI